MSERHGGETGVLLDPHDFEIDLGDNRVEVLQGNPLYCPIEQPHEPHRFDYAFRGRDGERVVGHYQCFGDPAPWAQQSDGCSS